MELEDRISKAGGSSMAWNIPESPSTHESGAALPTLEKDAVRPNKEPWKSTTLTPKPPKNPGHLPPSSTKTIEDAGKAPAGQLQVDPELEPLVTSGRRLHEILGSWGLRFRNQT